MSLYIKIKNKHLVYFNITTFVNFIYLQGLYALYFQVTGTTIAAKIRIQVNVAVKQIPAFPALSSVCHIQFFQGVLSKC